MKCSKCGAENRKAAGFCTRCGEALTGNVRRQRRRNPAGSSGYRKLAFIFGAVVVGLAMIIGLKRGQDGMRPAGGTPRAAAQVFSMGVRQVASKFFCGCGTCEVPELADCTCPTAVEEKEVIDRELKKGTPEQDVVKLVNDRYGKVKPQYASLVGGAGGSAAPLERSVVPKLPETAGASTLSGGLSGMLDTSSGPPGASAAAPEGIATEADSGKIASRFICACGQCRDHVLSECDCDHPRGAVEMKAFIQYKISQKRYAAEEIVQAVAYEYGHMRERGQETAGTGAEP